MYTKLSILYSILPLLSFKLAIRVNFEYKYSNIVVFQMEKSPHLCHVNFIYYEKNYY